MRRFDRLRNWTFAVVVVSCVPAAGCSGRSHPRASSRASTTTATQPVTTTTVGVTAYVVKHGDTLTSIANQFRVSVASILAANQGTKADRITEGQTLRIPPPPPRKLEVTPASGPIGQSFQLALGGAQPGEKITFKVQSPKSTFTGPPHTAGNDGTVSTAYQTGLTDPAGTYTVIAQGDQGTTVQGTFAVVADTPTT